MNQNIKGALVALASFAIYSAHDVIIKVLGGTYSPVQVLFFSGLFAFPVAMLHLLRDSTHGTLIPVHPWWIAARTVAAVINGFCAFYAFSVLPLAQVYAILFATPLLITMLAVPMLGEPVRLRRWIAVAVGLGGVLIVLRPGQSDLELGHLAALCSAITASFAAIILRKIGRDERSVVIMLYPMTATFIVMAALLPFVYQPPPIEDLGKFALIALGGWIAGRLVISAYNTAGPIFVAPMQYSQILWAAFYGLLFFDEWPDLGTAAGSAVIIASGLFIVFRESRSADSDQPVLRSKTRPETGTTPQIVALLRPDRRWRKSRTSDLPK